MIEQQQIEMNLKRRRAELAATLGEREIRAERSADELDALQHATDLDLTIRHINRESDTIRRIDAALQRLRDGDFGICLDCEEPISPARLRAIPWAHLCVPCQERADQRTFEDPAELLPEAA